METLVQRLSDSREVSAVVLFGSTAATVGPDSDFDVLIVLAADHVPYRTGVTAIEHRLTDLAFASLDEITRLDTGAGVLEVTDAWEGRFGVWIADGRVAFDRTGQVAEAHSRLSGRPKRGSMSSDDLRSRWGHANYNLAQSRRYANSGDPLYADAFQLRMTYQLADLMIDYFHARKLPWIGEKDAIRYWQSNDAPYFEALMACLKPGAPTQRFSLYESLVRDTYAPVGDLWPPNAEGFTPGPGNEGENGLAFWDSLLEGERR